MPMSPHWVANCCSLPLSLNRSSFPLSRSCSLFTTVFNFNHRHFVNGDKNAIGVTRFFLLRTYHTHTHSVHSLVQQHTMPLYFISLVLCTLDINNDNINNMHVFLHKIRSHKHQHILIKGFPYNFPQTCHMYAFALGVCVFNYYNVSLAFLCRPFVILLCISHKNLIH